MWLPQKIGPFHFAHLLLCTVAIYTLSTACGMSTFSAKIEPHTSTFLHLIDQKEDRGSNGSECRSLRCACGMAYAFNTVMRAHVMHHHCGQHHPESRKHANLWGTVQQCEKGFEHVMRWSVYVFDLVILKTSCASVLTLGLPRQWTAERIPHSNNCRKQHILATVIRERFCRYRIAWIASGTGSK